MGKYTGVPCAYCNKEFTENDDVVVCPICGAPHHRECYQKCGHCANEANHASGKEWQNPKQKQDQPPNGQLCPRCGAINPPEGIFCQYCGTKLVGSDPSQTAPSGGFQVPPHHHNPIPPQQPEQRPPQAGGNAPLITPVGKVYPDDSFDGVSAKEISIFVGPNARYFLTNFKIMQATGRNMTLNWPSFFLNFCYFAYRKMYGLTMAAITALLVIGIPRLLYIYEFCKYYLSAYYNYPITYNASLIASLEPWLMASNLLQFVLLLVLSLFFNRYYYKYVIKSIKKIRENFAMTIDNRPYYNALARSGRTNRGLAVTLGLGAIALYFLLIFTIVYNLMI